MKKEEGSSSSVNVFDSIARMETSRVASRSSIDLSEMASNTDTVGRRRMFSLESDLSDSDSSLENLIRKLSVRDKVLSKPQAKIDFLDTSDDSENEEEEKDSPGDNKDVDSLSAWSRKNDSGDYFLSSEKRADIPWPQLYLPQELYNQLFSFQRQGVQWMASLHKGGIGGILGDDMGMGKTYVTLSFLGGMMRAGTIQNALVVAPLSVLQSWEKEAKKILPKCTPKVKITVLSSEIARRTRLDMIDSIKRNSKKCNLVITSYGLIRSATSDFISSYDKAIWHYVALDEGHQIKNASAEISKACRAICSRDTRRLLLTGTPILNNLRELWSLFDFATNGKILGSSKQFTQYYANHIEAARDREASPSQIQIGQRKNTELQELIRPYFLQRLKIDFLKDKLPKKHDIVVWTHLSDEQRQKYTDFVESSDAVVHSMKGIKSPLEAVTWLKKLCGHPLLIETSGDQIREELRTSGRSRVLSQSSKLQVLLNLMTHLKRNGHRVLIFSQSTKMLDIIHFELSNKFILSRIDGSTPGKDRQRLVDEFNKDRSPYDAMLLSTKAAGCGLTLTGADTAIVYDPSWTPAEDAQAVDRCYRIGQTREVTVYRLIAAGTVEEKTYEKQIHKDGIRRAVLSQDEQVERYFQRSELSALFKLGPKGECRVMDKLQDALIDCARHEFVLHLYGVVGISRHDGFYESTASNAKAAFDGKTTSTPCRPRILGKSQRIMAREENKAMEIWIPPPRRQDNSSVPRKHSREAEDDENIADRAVDSMNEQSSGGDFKENDVYKPTSLNVSFTDTDVIATMISNADQLFEKKHYRKCLEVLIDMIESNSPRSQQKLDVHRRIATVAHKLQLI